MTTLTIDFETRSPVDLRKTGVTPYAKHADTDVWCAAWAIDDGPIELWKMGDPCPAALAAHVRGGGLLAAWNANFEIAIWRHIMTPRYGWPLPDLTQWRCSMVAAYAMSLPGSLENAAGAIGLDIGKDMSGRRVMLAMSQPRRPRKGEPDGLYWWDDEERKAKLYDYCKNDVEVERAIRKRLVSLRPSEQELWFLDQTINARGVSVDVELCRKAKAVVAHVTAQLDDEMREVTGGAVTRCSNIGELKTFVRAAGLDTEALDKEALAELLKGDDLAPSVRRALELRQEAGKASVAKINALLNGVDTDGRARDLLQFHAANTGRWAGRRFQPQNIRRPTESTDVDHAIGIILDNPPEKAARYLDMLYGPPLTIVSDCLRGMICAEPGNVLYAADFSNIEGRVLAWLAGEHGKLDAFRDFDNKTGPDLYKVAAGSIYGVGVAEVSKEQRQIGKVSELACGYQGGVGAFQTMAHTYGVKIADELAEKIVKAWRTANPAIKQYWWDLESACFDAVSSPGSLMTCRGVKFKVVGSFLWLQLPSGRALCYPYPTIQWKEMPWTDDDGRPVRKQVVAYKGVNSYTRKWETIYTYGGKLAENITQAVARDVMAEAMVRVEAAGYPVILTVHDEIVSEAPSDFGSLAEFERLMTVLPDWATGLPVAVGGFKAERYRK